MSDTPHLRQIPQSTVDELCDRAAEFSKFNYTVRLEVEGFRESRTPWDATRTANALSNVSDTSDDLAALVRDIDAAAEACARAVPANRMKRRA